MRERQGCRCEWQGVGRPCVHGGGGGAGEDVRGCHGDGQAVPARSGVGAYAQVQREE